MRKDEPANSQSRVQLNRNVPEELSEVCRDFADICDYFSRENMDLPDRVLEDIGCASKLSIPERIAAMDRLNQELIDYLHRAGKGTAGLQ